MSRGTSTALRRKLFALLLVLLGLVVVLTAFSASPLRAWLDIPSAVQVLRHHGEVVGPLVAIAAFAGACVVGVPVTFLTLVVIIAFGPLPGVGMTLLAAAIGGSTSYGVGRLLGREAVDRLAGERVALLNRRLEHRGLLAVALIRLVPAAPFAVVNMAIGVSHISLRQFVIGSTLGMLPGASAMALFVDQIVRSFETPGMTGVVGAVLLVLLVVGGSLALARLAGRPDKAPGPRSGSSSGLSE